MKKVEFASNLVRRDATAQHHDVQAMVTFVCRNFK
jgi:hypothetical protein